ncbi:hypothetical protein, partial [Escherichia coli]|uniref:hypothetical protein n=1 Tax=Escherichia coli TaxID=562 RepID=UPI0039E0F20E
YLDPQGVKQIDVQGGGDLLVSAENNVKGGSYLLGRGAGQVKAGGNIGFGDATQLYVMGESGSDILAKQASLSIEAGQGLNIKSVANP